MKDFAETKAEQRHRENMDLSTIEELKNAGSDLSKVHELEHHFVVVDIEVAGQIAEELRKDGYVISEILDGEDEDDGSTYYFFDAIKPCIMKPELVFAESKKMAVIAKRYGVLYDGWGTHIVESDEIMKFPNDDDGVALRNLYKDGVDFTRLSVAI